MIEEVKKAYIFVIHLTKPEGHAVFIPASRNLTFEMLTKKIEKDPKVMTLQGKDGANVIIIKPVDNISYIIEETVDAVQANLDRMKEMQQGSKVIQPKMMIPGRRR